MRLFYHPLTILAFSLLSLIFTISLYTSRHKMRSSTQQISVLEQEVNKLADNVNDLETDVQQATSSLTQEKIIRDELLMHKPDEIIVQLPAVETISPVKTTPSPSPSSWKQWMELLW